MLDLNPIDRIEADLENSELDEEQVAEFMEFVSNHYYEISYGTDSVKLQSLYVRNLQNIYERSVFFGGENKIIHGRNSQGKTSFINSIQFNLLGLPKNKQSHRMTNLIRDGEERLLTKGEWLTDSSSFLLERDMVRKGQGGALFGHNEPTITDIVDDTVEPPEDRETPQDRHNQPSEVFENIGILPFINRGYEVYDFMSLYFMLPHNFLNFIEWHKSSEVIDISFGIYLTNVLNAIDERLDSEAQITGAIAESRIKLGQTEENLSQARSTLNELQEKQDLLQSEIVDKTERLESLKQGTTAEERLNELRSQKSLSQARRAELKTEQSEKVSELAATKRKIQRYEDSELIDDIGSIGQELRSLMTVPDRCPICTNPVDGHQRERMLKHHHCPLCDKEVDDELIRVEREYQSDDSIFERREVQKEELDDLQSQRDKLAHEIERLDDEIHTVEQEISGVEDSIQQHDVEDVIEHRQELEREIRELRKEAVSIEVRIDETINEIERLEYEVWANEHLESLYEERKDLKEAWETLRTIVSRVRRDNRRSLQNRIREEIETEILPKFDRGMFAEVGGLTFDSQDNYHFTLHSPTQQFKSSRADQEAAEATLHALVFHTAVLKLLTEQSNAPPIRMLVIDSPMTNDMDESNRRDVTNLLTSLPEYLANYQVIISMAHSNATLLERLKKSPYSMEEFDRSSEETEDGSDTNTGDGAVRTA